MNSTSLSELARQITAFIGQTTAEVSPGELVLVDFEPNFDRLARELFAAQYQANEAYRRFSDSVGVSPDKVTRWVQIPFVPTSGFKDSELTSLPPADRPRVFFSSATTGQSRSRHFHNAESLGLYEAALKPWLYRYLVQPMAELEEGEGRTAVDGPGILSLTPPASAAPNSSLVHMLDVAVQEFAARDSVFAGLIGPESVWQIDYDRVLFALRKSMCANRPLLITGTAFNFVELLDFSESRNIRYRLAEGSRVMETGGYKGRTREVPREELVQLLGKRLGIVAQNVVSEYGMSELSSQAYETRDAAGTPSGYQFPPWVRIRLVSPESGREVPDGQPGLLQILDLANVWSVAAVQTGDLAIKSEGSFKLLGRAPKSEVRGCSLMTA